MDTSIFQMNWVDLAIIAILLYFASEAWRMGLWILIADFISFLLSLIIALRAYGWVADLLHMRFSVSASLANPIAFLLTAILVEVFLGYFFAHAVSRIPKKFWKKPWNNLLALIPALGEGVIIISFLLTLLLALPISPRIKSDISKSVFGGYMLDKTAGLEARVNQIFGGVINESLTYLTVRPGARESIPLTSEKELLVPDPESEQTMFILVNEERKKLGIRQLSWREELVPVARAHAMDMWERQYFGHVSPEGDDVGVRLDRAGVKYKIAGENLALAPTLSTAHSGLMNSEGHRANILEPEFESMGVGVIDNGIYGKMFVQIFTN